jgi:putative hydrolase of the HAD superfamily
LVTNGGADFQHRKISRFGLDAIFDFVLIEGEFGAGKPHPSVFSTAMRKLNVGSSETWMVGDDLERDIDGAQRLGIHSIWVDWRLAGLPPSSIVQPDRIVQSITQLAEESP